MQKLIESSLQQQKKLQSMSAYVPSHLPERVTTINQNTSRWYCVLRLFSHTFFFVVSILIGCPLSLSDYLLYFTFVSVLPETPKQDLAIGSLKIEEEPAPLPKVRNSFSGYLDVFGLIFS